MTFKKWSVVLLQNLNCAFGNIINYIIVGIYCTTGDVAGLLVAAQRVVGSRLPTFTWV